MRTADIAKRYLDYFAKHDHLIVPSASLISPNPTTLFTIAGMVPFIPYLMGEQTPPKRRMASNQKCVRTLDIDEVGKTTRHGTFFQMLGNFSFGDYFKEEAIHYAWELLTTSQDEGGYGFDPEKLWMTTFTDDDEARSMWINEGVDPEHIQKMGMEDNFWTTGGPGPGGPCSEIYVDRGPAFGKEGGPIADENRYIEIWDLVFENYEVDNVKSKTDLHIVGELENKNIDTGAGLERLAYLLQGKNNIYETDEVFPVIEAAEQLSGLKYGENEDADVRFRVVADHVRSALMIMSDGVRPSNVGRGYVLRRLLRRTVRSMRMLGVTDPVLPTLFPTSKAAMEASYPELNDTFHEVSESAYGEEDAFRRTLETGTTILDVAVNKAKSDSAEPVVAGEDAFKLHDTYGFPIELTLEMAAEQGVKVDEAKFRELMAEQKSPRPRRRPQEASQRGSFRLRRLQEDARQPDRLPRLHRHVRPRQGDRHHAGRQGFRARRDRPGQRRGHPRPHPVLRGGRRPARRPGRDPVRRRRRARSRRCAEAHQGPHRPPVPSDRRHAGRRRRSQRQHRPGPPWRHRPLAHRHAHGAQGAA